MQVNGETAAESGVLHAVKNFADQLKRHPEYNEFLKAYSDAENDKEVLRIMKDIFELRQQLRNEWDPEKEDKLNELQEKLGTLPKVKELHSIEDNLRQLFSSLNDVLSERLGVPFVAHARQGCCG